MVQDVCNSVRGVIAGGSIQFPASFSSPGYNTKFNMNFVTMHQSGNAIEFWRS